MADPEYDAATLQHALQDRYRVEGPLGAGGMGEVWRVRDLELGRSLALKLLRPSRADPDAEARFLAEAQLTAQLDHPGVAPIHERGELPDGTPYFTMKEVRGRTLAEVLATPGGELRRHLEALLRVAETVAYAHSRGVVHRDIKPANVILDDFGSVLLLDWGLARPSASVDPVVTDRSGFDAFATRVGRVAGTPAYMPPEQARGLAGLGPTADVYALGAVLYEILCGCPPFSGSGQSALDAVLAGPPPPIPESAPRELRALCEQSMARDPSHRHPDGTSFASALQSWLDGDFRREVALAHVREADRLAESLPERRSRALALRAEARRRLASLPLSAPASEKAPWWEAEDEAGELDAASALAEEGMVRRLQAALTHAPELEEAHDRLAALYQARQAAAEAAGDPSASAFAERVRDHDRHGRYASWLEGTGSIALATLPEGAEVTLSRFVLRGRRLVPERVGVLGVTPLSQPLPMGSWLLEISTPGGAPRGPGKPRANPGSRRGAPDEVGGESRISGFGRRVSGGEWGETVPVVRYPVYIGRQQAWDGVPPGGTRPRPIGFPQLGERDRYVPAGWFVAGDHEARNGLPARREWVDGFVMRAAPVTNREFIHFLDDLVAAGREAEALAYVPRETVSDSRRAGPPVYGRGADGGFVLQPDAQGDPWHLDWPVVLVDWHAATAFSAWEARRTGEPWRLPTELEREKAARGVDGRRYPWGDFPEPTWANSAGARPGRPMLARVQDFPDDVSVYGVTGLAGNSRDWCAAPPGGDPGGWRVYRGGGWNAGLSATRSADRLTAPPEYRASLLGFRLARSLVG